MSEEELNEQFIQNKLQDICQDCIHFEKLIPEIRKMLSERYIMGLEQGKFDKTMELEDNQTNYYQVIDGTSMYYEWYVKQLQQENKTQQEKLDKINKYTKDSPSCSWQEVCEDIQKIIGE